MRFPPVARSMYIAVSASFCIIMYFGQKNAVRSELQTTGASTKADPLCIAFSKLYSVRIRTAHQYYPVPKEKTIMRLILLNPNYMSRRYYSAALCNFVCVARICPATLFSLSLYFLASFSVFSFVRASPWNTRLVCPSINRDFFT